MKKNLTFALCVTIFINPPQMAGEQFFNNSREGKIGLPKGIYFQMYLFEV